MHSRRRLRLAVVALTAAVGCEDQTAADVPDALGGLGGNSASNQAEHSTDARGISLGNMGGGDGSSDMSSSTTALPGTSGQADAGAPNGGDANGDPTDQANSTGNETPVAADAGVDETPSKAICDASTTVCSGTSLDTCNADGSAWETTACEFACTGGACTGGACTGECVPGAARCNDLDSEICDAAGQWQVQTVCPYECSGGGECTGSCTEPDTRCTEDGNVEMCVYTSCEGDECTTDWLPFDTCEFTCSAGACAGSCETGTTQCAGKAFQACEGNEFVTTESCEFACDGAAGCYGSCDPAEAPTCNGNTLESCQDGQPSQFECPFVCQNGGCAGVCVPGDTRCGSGNVETCNAEGQWEVSEACTGGDNQTAPCDPVEVACQVQCQTGFDDCDGEPSNGCEADLSSEATCLACGTACGAGESCQAEGCVLDPVCTPWAMQCAGNSSQECDADGQWQTVETCEFVCSGAGECTGECNSGDTSCDGNDAQTCSAENVWVSTPCEFVCSEGACAGSCTPGDTQCDGARGTRTCQRDKDLPGGRNLGSDDHMSLRLLGSRRMHRRVRARRRSM